MGERFEESRSGMCGRMVLTRSADEIADYFEASGQLELEARYNVAPSTWIPAVLPGEGGERTLTLLRWGLIPSWARDPAIGNRMINARSETAAEKPSFRSAMRRRRCLLPADGFYEWAPGERKGDRKRPHYFTSTDGSLLAIAGLYESWTSKETGEVIQSCTLLTTEANAVVRPIHDRMPVLLSPDDFGRWLDVEGTPVAEASAMLVPSPPDRLEQVEVGTLVNDVRNDSPECIAAL